MSVENKFFFMRRRERAVTKTERDSDLKNSE